MQHFSRSQWNQIIARAKKVDFTFDKKFRPCIMCGFHFSTCPHTEAEVTEVLAEARSRAGVAV